MALLDQLGHHASMGEVLDDGVEGGARALARMVEPFHAITYYSAEMADLTDAGYRGWWHAYFGYRPAPMGPVGPGIVTATFYNFAPRMVERAVPGVWSINSPPDSLAIRLDRVTRALDRIYGSDSNEDVRSASILVRQAVDHCEVAGRPLFGAYSDLEWPDAAVLSLWHGCTLLREYRGDSHNLALANADVDGVMSHVLMAGRGHGNRRTILAIRGWTEDEWETAVRQLVDRGWANPDGSLTMVGRDARSDIERHTDSLASAPINALGSANLQRLLTAMRPLVDRLKVSGEVSGRWPPEHLIKGDGE